MPARHLGPQADNLGEAGGPHLLPPVAGFTRGILPEREG